MSLEFTPRELVGELDKFIVGQQDAKRAVAIAVRNPMSAKAEESTTARCQVVRSARLGSPSVPASAPGMSGSGIGTSGSEVMAFGSEVMA